MIHMFLVYFQKSFNFQTSIIFFNKGDSQKSVTFAEYEIKNPLDDPSYEKLCKKAPTADLMKSATVRNHPVGLCVTQYHTTKTPSF